MTSPPLLISSMRLPLASVGQTGAASCAAASQDLAAIGSSHALAEPVDLGAMTLLRLIGTNHSDTPPVSISSGMQASANHNSRIAPAAVVNQLCAIPFHDYAKIIIAEKKWQCQPKISEEKWEKSVIFPFHPRYCGSICFRIHLFGKIFPGIFIKKQQRSLFLQSLLPFFINLKISFSVPAFLPVPLHNVQSDQARAHTLFWATQWHPDHGHQCRKQLCIPLLPQSSRTLPGATGVSHTIPENSLPEEDHAPGRRRRSAASVPQSPGYPFPHN